MVRWLLTLSAISLTGWGFAAPIPPTAKVESPTAKVRTALNKKISITFESKSVEEVLESFRSMTNIPIELDPLFMDTVILPENGITIEIKDITVRDALRKVFGRFGYETGIVRDGIFIATEEAIIQKQLRQRVAVDAEDRPLPQVLKALAQESGANIILDPRLAKKAQENLISITLDDVPLEVAVRLVAEVGSLRTIRMSNVLFVTDDARAEKLKDDADKPFKPGNTLNPFFPSMNFPGPGGLGGGAAGGAAIPEVDR